MTKKEQARFKRQYTEMLIALELQGLRAKTVDAYSRAVRRTAEFFDCSPDTLTAKDLKTYFAALVKSHSWSTVKLDRNGLQFFYRHVLNKQWDWVSIVKPPQVRTLPDILCVEDVFELINSVRKLRYRVFFWSVYSMGLRLNEALNLEVGDIDAKHNRIHIRLGKGGKDRYVILPTTTLYYLRQYWKTHRHPRLLFPNPVGGPERMAKASTPMCSSGVQSALKAVLAERGIKRKITVHSMRHCWATHMLEIGIDLREIQTLMGHARPETTARYTQLTDITHNSAKEGIEKLFKSFALRWENEQ